MTIRRNRFVGQPNNTAATVTNLDDSGDGFTAVNIAGASTVKFQTASPPDAAGSVWVEMVPELAVSPGGQVANIADSTLTGNDYMFSVRWQYPAAHPTVANTTIGQFRNVGGGSRIGELVGNTNGKPNFQASGGGTLAAWAGTALVPGTVYDVFCHVHTDTATPANGTVDYTFTEVSTGTVKASGSATGVINGGAVGEVRFGSTKAADSTTGNWSSWKFSRMQWGTQSTDPGAYPTNVPPTADAGPDLLDVEPYTTFTLNGTGSADSDGTITGYAWTPVAGTTVALTGPSTASPTGTAPGTWAGVTLSYQLIVTDNNGATSVADTVNVFVRPHSIFRMDAGGVMTPLPATVM